MEVRRERELRGVEKEERGKTYRGDKRSLGEQEERKRRKKYGTRRKKRGKMIKEEKKNENRENGRGK